MIDAGAKTIFKGKEPDNIERNAVIDAGYYMNGAERLEIRIINMNVIVAYRKRRLIIRTFFYSG